MELDRKTIGRIRQTIKRSDVPNLVGTAFAEARAVAAKKQIIQNNATSHIKNHVLQKPSTPGVNVQRNINTPINARMHTKSSGIPSSPIKNRVLQTLGTREVNVQGNRNTPTNVRIPTKSDMQASLAAQRSGAPTANELALMKKSTDRERAYNEAQKAKLVEKHTTAVTHGLGYAARPSVPVAIAPSYAYSVRDTLGRQQILNESQYKALNKANSSNNNKNIVYHVIPEEVANANTNWWINSRGQYEWVPVTASDKAHLADLNRRTGKNMTTLFTGAAKSDEYSKKWYSTGGGNSGVGERNVKKVAKDGSVTNYGPATYTPTGSGSEKLAAMKAGSSANSNASAKSGTAQDAKAKVVTTGERKEAQALIAESKIRHTLEKYNSKAEYTAAMDLQKAAQKAAQKEYQKQLEAYTDVVTSSGVIDAITGKGQNGIGEGAVRVIRKDKSGKIIASSKTASDYKKETSDVALDRQVKALENYMSKNGMSKTKQLAYLTGLAAKDLPKTGTASDIWTKLNTDIFSGKADQKLAGQIKAGNTTDVLDNIARKQIAGKQLTAQEAALLGRVESLYKPSTRVSGFVDNVNGVAKRVSGIAEKHLGTRTSEDYKFAGKYSTKLADFVNSMNGAVIETPEMLAMGAGGIAKAGEYAVQQAKQGNLKHAGSNTALLATYYGSQMGRGMAKQAHDDPVKFVASCALAEVVIGGAAKGVGKASKAVTKTVGTKTGIVRTKALGSEIIPYKEVGTVLDDMRAGKQIEGMHASVYKQAKGKKVFVNEPGKNPNYVEPGTFGHKGQFSTVSDGAVEPFGEYFLTKTKRTFIADKAAAVVKPVSKVVNPITGKVIKVLKTEVAKPVGRATKPLKTALDKPAAKPIVLAGKAATFTAKQAGKILKNNFEKNMRKVTTRQARAGEKAVYRVSGDSVKLTETQWNRIYSQFKKDGNFWGEYEKIQKIAQRQANKSGKPVATPSPKSAYGVLEAESEVWWVFPEKGVKVTSSQVIGKTPHGVKIVEVRYGKQAPVIKKSLFQRMKENRAYNQQMVKAIDGKKYNLNHIKSYANDANRRLGELYGGKTTRPGAYEGGAHGKTHTESVGNRLTKQNKPVAGEVDYWLGVMHDITKIGPHETAGVPHAVAAAEVIKRGMIADTEFNRFFNRLSKAKQAEFVKAISEHTTIKPINKHLITESSSIKSKVSTLKAGVKTVVKDRPSAVSKALANADRLDLTRFGVKPKKSMLFDLKNKPVKPKVKLSERVKSGLSAKNAKAKIAKAKMGIKTKARTTKRPTKTYTDGYKKPSYKPSYKPYATAKAYGAITPKTATYTEFMKGVEGIYKLRKSENAYKPMPKAGKSYTKKYTQGKRTYKPATKPYSKPYKAPANKPYVKPYTKPTNKPYVKPYIAPETKPYVKPYVQPEATPYAKPYVASPYKSGSGGGGYSPIRNEPVVPTPVYKRKKASTAETGKTGIKYKTAHRTRKNVLGDVESFFGGSSTKKTPAKKRTTKRKSKTR